MNTECVGTVYMRPHLSASCRFRFFSEYIPPAGVIPVTKVSLSNPASAAH